jgi:hypothetical protein
MHNNDTQDGKAAHNINPDVPLIGRLSIQNFAPIIMPK